MSARRTRWCVTFTDGATRYVDGYHIYVDDGVLRIRTSHDTSYAVRWLSFPLANVRSWEAS